MHSPDLIPGKVIVTVMRQDDDRAWDVEIPTDQPVDRLIQMITQAMRWDADAAGRPLRYEAVVHPGSRVLRPSDTLAAAGVWDGAWLILQRVSR